MKFKKKNPYAPKAKHVWFAKKILTSQTPHGLVVLSTECTPVDFTDPKQIKQAKRIVKALLKTANKHYPECLGLSANQIGFTKRIIVVRNERGGRFVPLINPVVIGKSGGMKMLVERCLSRTDSKGNLAPGIKMRRHKHVLIEFYDVVARGISKTTLTGILARATQHEIDHLNGTLI